MKILRKRLASKLTNAMEKNSPFIEEELLLILKISQNNDWIKIRINPQTKILVQMKKIKKIRLKLNSM